MTLATVEAGKPRARTVLFQGLSERRQGTLGVCVKMSKHSRKVRNADSPAVEVVWWLQETGVQFRLSGTISYDDQAERVRVWNSLGAGAKSQFFYDADQGLDSSTSGALFQEEEEQRSRQGLVAVPDSFVVGVVFPTEVDFLDLNTLQRINWQAVNGDPHAAEGWEEVKGFAPPVVSTVPTAVNTKTGISNKDEL